MRTMWYGIGCFDRGTGSRMLAVMASLVSPPASGNQHLYCRHRPEETALYPLIEANLALLLEHLCEREAPLPRFVTDEFKEYPT